MGGNMSTKNLKQVLATHGVIDDHLKYTELEIASLLDKHLCRQEGRIRKAIKIYKEQRSRINELSSPELWRFGPKREAPPDYKAEYLRRLRAGDSLSFGVKVTKNPPDEEYS
jgi:hypothetical protein